MSPHCGAPVAFSSCGMHSRLVSSQIPRLFGVPSMESKAAYLAAASASSEFVLVAAGAYWSSLPSNTSLRPSMPPF